MKGKTRVVGSGGKTVEVERERVLGVVVPLPGSLVLVGMLRLTGLESLVEAGLGVVGRVVVVPLLATVVESGWMGFSERTERRASAATMPLGGL